MKLINLMLGLTWTALFGISAQSARAYDVKIDIPNGSVILKDIPADYRASVCTVEDKPFVSIGAYGTEVKYTAYMTGEIFNVPYARTVNNSAAELRIIPQNGELPRSDGKVMEADFSVDGLCYKINSNGQYVDLVDSEDLNGQVIVPFEVQYEGNIYIVKNIQNYAFQNQDKVTEIIIESPSDDTKRDMRINYGVFAGCLKLQLLDFPTDLDHVEPSMIDNCVALNTVICRSKIAPDLSSSAAAESFINTHGIVLYYPKDSSYYLTSSFWKSFNKKLLSDYNPENIFTLTLSLSDDKGSITLYDVAPGDKMEFICNGDNNSQYNINLGDHTFNLKDGATVTIPDNLSGNVMLALDKAGQVSAINDITDEKLPYVISENRIEVNAQTPLIITDTLGHKIFQGLTGTINLTSGIYIVRYGAKARKLIIN